MAFKIAIDAGHYLGTAGKRLPALLDKAQTREWTLNDRVARHFAAAAAEYEGVETFRVDDPTGKRFVDLDVRCAKAHELGADFYLSVHHNAGALLTNAGGIVAYSYRRCTMNSATYRDAIYDACIAAGGIKGNRAEPKQGAGYDVLVYTNRTKIPAVLMEYGFMDSRIDYKIILDDAYSKLVAYATMAGIAKVAGLKRKGEKPAAALKSVEEIAREVIAGKWWTGAARKSALTAAGYDYNEVQKTVNAILSGKQPATKAKSVDELAREVIAGKWGTGITRKQKLKAAGYDPAAVQKRVNEMLKG